jgi:glycosyltransferase involved in cell wall biosynthesis
MLRQPIVEQNQGLLLVVQVPFRQQGNRLYFESQACNGLERWADNFGSITVVAPLMPEALAETESLQSMVWQAVSTIAQPERFQFVPMPRAYKIPEFLKCYQAGRTVLADLIVRHRYLQFGLGPVIGDWAMVGALEAIRQQRNYAIHADWVEHEVMRRVAQNASLKTRLRAKVVAPIVENLNRWIIERAQLGLWHGADCYTAYSPFCPNSFSIHNTHTKPADLIGAAALAEKLDRCLTDPVLRVCYVGRMAAMKAPIDWVNAIAKARDLGVNLQATWVGDGPMRGEVEAAIRSLELENCIELTGFERDRHAVMQKIRSAHLMMFTHITPESPRCLIEALINGTPIVGYESQYSEELVSSYGGGTFTPLGNWEKLAGQLCDLADDRSQLAQLTQQAAMSGSRFTDEAVFYERSELMKQYLNQPSQEPVQPPVNLPGILLESRV